MSYTPRRQRRFATRLHLLALCWPGLSLCLCLCSSAALAAPTGADDKALDDLRKEVGRFEEASKSYKGVVQHVVHQSYVERRRELAAKYDSTVKAEEADERQK